MNSGNAVFRDTNCYFKYKSLNESFLKFAQQK